VSTVTIAAPAVTGLTTAEAAARRRAEGDNTLPATRRPPALVHFAVELVQGFATMLWVAAILAWLARLPTLTAAIAAVVVLNAAFAFFQEHRAERAADRLRQLLPDDGVVRRDGRERTVASTAVVRGDLVVLTAGDRVPADGLLVTSGTVSSTPPP
jgi:magnesium-transporting ATPase (P-type)